MPLLCQAGGSQGSNPDPEEAGAQRDSEAEGRQTASPPGGPLVAVWTLQSGLGSSEARHPRLGAKLLVDQRPQNPWTLCGEKTLDPGSAPPLPVHHAHRSPALLASRVGCGGDMHWASGVTLVRSDPRSSAHGSVSAPDTGSRPEKGVVSRPPQHPWGPPRPFGHSWASHLQPLPPRLSEADREAEQEEQDREVACGALQESQEEAGPERLGPGWPGCRYPGGPGQAQPSERPSRLPVIWSHAVPPSPAFPPFSGLFLSPALWFCPCVLDTRPAPRPTLCTPWWPLAMGGLCMSTPWSGRPETHTS